MDARKYLTFALSAILFVSFLFGALAPVSRADNPANWWRPPVLKCVTEFDTSIDIKQISGSYSCDAERCFYLDGCRDDNVWYECCYRYNKGLCDCWCKVVELCD